ncbi:MAG TPA: hypothetical protein VH475_01355 [Tepidisphaeraceae bacterium]
MTPHDRPNPPNRTDPPRRRPTPRTRLGVILLLGAAACGGCQQSLAYRGVSPDVRTFSEDPSMSQYYIGMDVEFGLVDASPADPDKSLAAQTAPPQEPLDPDVVPRPLPEPNIPF